jgi:hypothetical protein
VLTKTVLKTWNQNLSFSFTEPWFGIQNLLKLWSVDDGSLSKGGELGLRNNFYFGCRSSYYIKVGENRGGSGGFQVVSETIVLFQFSVQKAISCVYLSLSIWSELEYEHESKVVESIKENNFCIGRFSCFFVELGEKRSWRCTVRLL